MAQQTINVGTAPNDGTGTPLRTAFQYTNSNFSELYTAVGPSGNNIVVPGSATITGDLTVDTSTLYVSSSADKVGIGTTSLSNEKLTVAGNISANAWLGRSNISVPSGDCSIFRSADNTLGFGIASSTAMTLNSNGLGIGTGSPSGASGRVLEIYGGAGQSRIALKNDTTGSASTDGSQIALVGSQLVIQNREASEITFETNNSERYRLDSTGVATWSNVGGVAGTAMTLNSTGLGLGVASPAQKLDVAGSIYISNNAAYLYGKTSGGLATRTFGINAANDVYIGSIDQSINNIRFNSGGTDRLLIDSSGNVGIGVTPSAKLDVVVTSADGIRVKNTLATSAYSNRFHISDNTGIAFVGYCPSYVGGTNFGVGANGQSIISDSAGPLAIGTNTAQSLFLGSNGVTRITLDSSGNVISNVPATAPTLGIDRQMVFNLTSNTNLRISVRGSDGVTRTTNLTLA